MPADELCNKGRLSQGDVAFISRNLYGCTPQLQKNQKQLRQIVTSASTAHANVSRIAGLDYINRALGPMNYKEGSTVLKDSNNPLDDWRSLSFLNEWTVDGIIMSNDSPGYVTGVSGGARNDQVFNMGIQGPVQLNNGYVDDAGRGLAAHYDRQRQLAAGEVGGANAIVPNLIAGPFYEQYPLQMFDRKVRPLSDLYIGLICRKIESEDLDAVNASSGDKFNDATHIHVFEYVCFSSRQVYQFATKPGGTPDFDIVDTGVRNVTEESEPAYRPRGPNDAKRARGDNFEPRKRGDAKDGPTDTFLGIKKVELTHMVGAWRLGKVLDVASKRMQGYTGGPIDTAFNVTLNFNLEFLDWRQLRRNFTSNIFGKELDPTKKWTDLDVKRGQFTQDDLRVMQWPTMYYIYGNTKPSPDEDANIPINPEHTDEAAVQRDSYGASLDNIPVSMRDDNLDEIDAPGPGASDVQSVRVERVASSPRAVAASPPAVAASPPAASAPAAAASATETVNVGEDSLPSAKATAKQVAPTARTSSAVPNSVPGAAVRSVTKPAAKPASRTTTKPTGSIGDEVMASIFGSSIPASLTVNASDTGTVAPAAVESGEAPAAQPRSFPRRRDR